MTQFNVSQVYQELQELVADPKSGFRQRSYLLDNGNNAVVIDYTLSSYQYFKKPSGLRGRGIMFEVDPQGNLIRILARPMLKFFSYNECPDTMKLNMAIENIVQIADKADGSLMSTWIYEDKLRIKSKGSINSAEVKGTMALLESDKRAPLHQANATMKQILGSQFDQFQKSDASYADLAKVLEHVSKQGYTVDLEYLCKAEPIVIQYSEDELRVLSINDLHSDAEYTMEQALQMHILNEEQYAIMKAFQAYPYYDSTFAGTPGYERLKTIGFDAFLKEIESIKGIEGVIITLNPGQSAQRIKFKTQKYLTHTQALTSLSFDSRFPEEVYTLREPFAVFAAIAEGYADDLIHAVRECPPLANMVRTMQEELIPLFNTLQHQLHTFVEQHKHMEKRDFVAESKKVLHPALAAAAMQMLVHGNVNLIQVIKKNKGLLPDLNKYAISKQNYPEHLKQPS